MRIAVTGIGIVTSLGIGYKANAEALRAGCSALTFTDAYTPGHSYPLGVVNLHPDGSESRNTLLGERALRECLDDSSLSHSQICECPFINGATIEPNATTEALRHYAGFADSITISTACSAALNAIIHGAVMLRTGAAARVIAGGVEALTEFHVNGFASLGILSDEVCRPFQSDRKGINLGEGAAYLLLEAEAEALKRGAHIYGYIAGYGNRCDAYHFTASSPEGTGAQLAMSEALSSAGLNAADIEYVNAHGTATENNDESELTAMQRLFADGLPSMESTKSLTGHTTSASGSIEAVFTIMRMKERSYTFAMTNAFAFGGNDSSLILSSSPADLPPLCEVGDVIDIGVVTLKEDVEWRSHLPLMTGRRLAPVMRAAVVAAKMAIEKSGGVMPDAIITGTKNGVLSVNNTLNEQLKERSMSPALFMISTHNSVAGVLATTLQCNGFNIAYSYTEGREAVVEECARTLMKGGLMKRVLLCTFDEGDSNSIKAKILICSD